MIAQRATPEQVDGLLASPDAAARLAGVLAAGFRLTVPPAIGEIPAELPLRYESGNALFTIQYADKAIDLKKLGRVGSFTTAERWKAISPSDAERRLAAALVARLDDDDPRIREQAAYFLWLLDDQSFNPLVAKARRATVLQSLAQAPRVAIGSVWQIGPFDDGAASVAAMHAFERGPIDVAAPVANGSGSLEWRRVDGGRFALSGTSRAHATSSYLYFRLQTLDPQSAALDVDLAGAIKAWHNGRQIAGRAPLVLALESGSNDVLLRVAHDEAASQVSLAVRALGRVEAVLPERLGRRFAGREVEERGRQRRRRRTGRVRQRRLAAGRGRR